MAGILIGGGGAGGLGAALAEALAGGMGGGSTAELSTADRARVAELRREEHEDQDIYLHKLREAFESDRAIVPHVFAVGDLIQHRDAAGEGSIFTDKRPGIVVEVLARPVFPTDGSSTSAEFRKPLDLRVGAIRGGFFKVWHVSARDFVPHPAQT